MILLDTDHLSILQHAESEAADALRLRLKQSVDRDIGTTVISLEEQSRSWLDLIRRYSDARQQVEYYARFADAIRFFEGWWILPFDGDAANQFRILRAARIRIGTSDLKIAAIALTSDATLLTRNLRDFSQVPGLRVENWIGP